MLTWLTLPKRFPGLLARGCARIAAIAFVVIGTGAGCAMFSQDRPEIEMEEVKFSFENEESQGDRFDRYFIAPGDVLDVMFYINSSQGQEEFRLSIDNQIEVKFPDMPELNEVAIIRPDGNISLPYLGEVKAAGLTVGELTEQLKGAYAKILRKPELFVAVPDFRNAIREFKDDLRTYGRGLSRLATVRPDGQATFAIVGDLMVSGKTMKDVQLEINARYARVLPGLSATLSLEAHSGSRVYVLGEVGTPGAYEIARPTTVVEVLALAGSPLRSAKLKSVVVMRRRAGKMVGMRVNAKSALQLRRDSFFFYLQPNDIVYVPKTTIARIGDVAEDVQRMLFFNGWGLSYDLSARDVRGVSATVTTSSSSSTQGNTTTTTGTQETDYDY